MSSGRGIKLTEQHLRLMYDTFCLLDDDKDGRIDKDQVRGKVELRSFLSFLNLIEFPLSIFY
ncbi:myosin regulatory light chain, putative [Eimeria necatrix]|uniref:Myosin regulatory light chain, putative n=1 Tax=Eimeria necatrix TaxID=51315 RepID=U6MLA3_9EIME|nr:myosin regulatory light chain, putative [Eimeria necatrix]CDJ63853.1 myosin regulatory light chain, putative [Eimeria necatrix]